jgi:endonuclease/exonuclease/phosphatase family metal-dependent hydrolase
MVGAWATVSLLGDRVWWSLPFLFGPRWVAGVLLGGLLPALVLARPTAWRAGTIMLLVFVLGLLDFRLGLGRLEPDAPFALRVMELNSGAGSGGGPKLESVLAEMDRTQPDLVVVAECSAALLGAMESHGGWQLRRAVTSVCLASRYPILQWEERDPMDFWKEGGAGAIARATLQTPGGRIRVGLVHLETPRDALDHFPDLSSIPTLGNITRQNIAQRERESRVAREWIFAGESLPTIVAGDLNLPIESAIYRRHWSGLRNAFSRGGIGFGSTKQTRLWGIRIDHILTTAHFTTRSARLGQDVGSDHRPLLAELSLSPD